MIKIITTLLALVITINTIAQNASESAFNFKKIMVPSLTMEFTAAKKIAEKAVLDKLNARFGKSKGEKDFEVFRGIRIPEIGPDVYDLYIFVDKIKKADDKSTINMLLSLGNENWISSTNNAVAIENSKTFLQSMVPWVNAGNLEKQIKDAEDEVRKAEKKYDNSVDDGRSLEKKKANIERDIEENKNEQNAKKAEVDKQRQALETLKAQRKG